MPLKYLANMPAAVRIVGSIHGLLFLAFIALLFKVALEKRWPLRRSLLALGAAFVPFGAFVLERSLRRETRED